MIARYRHFEGLPAEALAKAGGKSGLLIHPSLIAMDDENDANESWVGVISRRKGQQKIYRPSILQRACPELVEG